MAIFFIIIIKVLNRNAMDGQSYFHDFCMINQTNCRCFISFAFIKKAYWRQDLRHDHHFINLIIFSFHSNRLCVFFFAPRHFLLIYFFFTSFLWPNNFFLRWRLCLPHPNQIQRKRKKGAKKEQQKAVVMKCVCMWQWIRCDGRRAEKYILVFLFSSYLIYFRHQHSKWIPGVVCLNIRNNRWLNTHTHNANFT